MIKIKNTMKNTLNLHDTGLVELDATASEKLIGGFFWAAVAASFIASVFASAVNNFGDIRQGLQDGFNGTPRYWI
jgi:hypothetical protein